MTTSAPRALAVELHRASPAQWVATYYPMVVTAAGRWAEVTWDLHQRLMPTKEPLSAQEAQLLRDGTFVVPAGQLSEWVLDDLEDETLGIQG